jgi:hypothetical protein
MKVRELIAFLQNQDIDAEVLIMSQHKWPFEHASVGVTVRKDIDEESERLGYRPRYAEGEDGTASSDVFIVEGAQLRYGSKSAWDISRPGCES